MKVVNLQLGNTRKTVSLEEKKAGKLPRHQAPFKRPLERTTGIEPASEAWEASILPMNYVRRSIQNFPVHF